MSWESEHQAIQAHFASGWSDTPVSWPNVQFEPDSDPLLAVEPFVRYQIRPTNNDFAAIGSGDEKEFYRETGDLFITVLVPQGRGEKQANIYADKIAKLMRNKRIGNTLTRAATRLAGTFESGWYVVPVQIPYQIDTFEAQP